MGASVDVLLVTQVDLAKVVAICLFNEVSSSIMLATVVSKKVTREGSRENFESGTVKKVLRRESNKKRNRGKTKSNKESKVEQKQQMRLRRAWFGSKESDKSVTKRTGQRQHPRWHRGRGCTR